MAINTNSNVDDVKPDQISWNPEQAKPVPHRSEWYAAEGTLGHIAASRVDEGESGAEIWKEDERCQYPMTNPVKAVMS